MAGEYHGGGQWVIQCAKNEASCEVAMHAGISVEIGSFELTLLIPHRCRPSDFLLNCMHQGCPSSSNK